MKKQLSYAEGARFGLSVNNIVNIMLANDLNILSDKKTFVETVKEFYDLVQETEKVVFDDVPIQEIKKLQSKQTENNQNTILDKIKKI